MSLPDFALDDRVAVVTGASKGLGREIALVMAEAGADVVVAARDEAGLEATAAGVREHGRRAHVVRTDVTKAEDIQHMIDSAIEAFGRIDVLVNNAGVDIVGSVVDHPGVVVSSPRPQITVDGWDRVMDTNLKSAFLACQMVGKHMLERKSGRVINIGSVEGATGKLLGDSAYAASKAALAHFSRMVALEWAPFGVTVNCLAPGLFWTDVWQGAFPTADGRERAQAAHRPKIPMGYWGDLRDVALLAVFLASDAAKYITGQTVYVDGGFSAA